MAAASVLAFAVAGCGGMGGNKSSPSLGAGQAMAATPPTVSFAQADLDGDARITPHEFDLWRKSEAGAAAAAGGGSSADDAFFAADTNVNGVLTLDEWQAMMAAPSAASGGRTTIAPPPAQRPR